MGTLLSFLAIVEVTTVLQTQDVLQPQVETEPSSRATSHSVRPYIGESLDLVAGDSSFLSTLKRTKRITANLKRGFLEPSLFVLGPAGQISHYSETDLRAEGWLIGERLDFNAPCDFGEGRYRLGLYATGPRGPAPCLLADVYFGGAHRQADGQVLGLDTNGNGPLESALYDAVNKARTKTGLDKLAWDYAFAKLARSSAEELSEGNQLSHISSAWGNIAQRANKLFGWTTVSWSRPNTILTDTDFVYDVIVVGTSVDEAMMKWLEMSPAHRAAILDRYISRCGVSAIPMRAATTNEKKSFVFIAVLGRMHDDYQLKRRHGIGADDMASLEMITRGLTSKSVRERVESASALAEDPVDREQIAKLLLQALGDEDPVVRSLCAVALGRMHTWGGMASMDLCMSLKDEYYSVRAAAAEALKNTYRGEKVDVNILIEKVDRADVRVRECVPIILRRMGKRGVVAVPTLVRLLKDRDSYVRSYAALALGKMAPEANVAIPDLIELLKENDVAVVRSAYLTLCQLGPGDDMAATAVSDALKDRGEPFTAERILEAWRLQRRLFK